MGRRNIEKIVPGEMVPHREEPAGGSLFRDWSDDEFGRWVSTHREELKDLVCGSASHKDAMFCERPAA